MSLLQGLDARDVAVCETFVVPRYLSMFASLAFEMIVPCEGSVVANVGCRTGYPDQLFSQHLPHSTVIGWDPSEPALELARTKSSLIKDMSFDYRVAIDLPFEIADDSFSHVLTLVPMLAPGTRPLLVQEMTRMLAPGGQVLFAMPLRGSYQEVADLLREYALKHDASEIAKVLESNIISRPTIETFSEEFEDFGLTDVDVEVRARTLTFTSARDFFEDPITRLMIIPDIELSLGTVDMSVPLHYVKEAIDKYWSEGNFELTVNVGCASARKF